jgi:hypothetical protein
MDDIRNWLIEFKKKYFDVEEEVIAFDIICGDFNMDNSSPGNFLFP